MKNLDDILISYIDGSITAGEAINFAFNLFDKGEVSEAMFNFVFDRLAPVPNFGT